MTTITRTLPADVYDALELSAMAFGGIGRGDYEFWGDPCCIFGHAMAVEDRKYVETAEIAWTLTHKGIGTGISDDAVERINQRLGRHSYNRVPFADWCAELGVVRGDS